MTPWLAGKTARTSGGAAWMRPISTSRPSASSGGCHHDADQVRLTEAGFDALLPYGCARPPDRRPYLAARHVLGRRAIRAGVTASFIRMGLAQAGTLTCGVATTVSTSMARAAGGELVWHRRHPLQSRGRDEREGDDAGGLAASASRPASGSGPAAPGVVTPRRNSPTRTPTSTSWTTSVRAFPPRTAAACWAAYGLAVDYRLGWSGAVGVENSTASPTSTEPSTGTSVDVGGVRCRSEPDPAVGWTRARWIAQLGCG